MDATASREPTWDRACQVQGQMFLETAALGGLEVQLVYYRGFDECRASRWVSQPSDLVRLMTRVFCLAGQTKIGRVLQHAVRETQRSGLRSLCWSATVSRRTSMKLARSRASSACWVCGVPVPGGHNLRQSERFGTSPS